MYTPQLLDHFEHPRNAGEVEDADAAAEVSNPVCGDVLRVTLRMRLGHIDQICFKAKGCVPAIACGSALTELVLGKTAAEARQLRREELIWALGGIPQASTHAAQLALDVLNAVLKQIEHTSSRQKP